MRSVVFTALCFLFCIHNVSAQHEKLLKAFVDSIRNCSDDRCYVDRAIKLTGVAIESGALVAATIIADEGLLTAIKKHDRTADLFTLKGQAFFSNSLFDSAKANFDKALVAQDDGFERAFLHLYKGYTFDARGDFDAAAKSYQEALEQFHKSGNLDDTLLDMADNAICLVSLHLEKFDDAMNFATKAAERFQAKGDVKSYALELETIANIRLKRYYKKNRIGNKKSDLLTAAYADINKALSLIKSPKGTVSLDEYNLMLTKAEIEMELGNRKRGKEILDVVERYGINNLIPERRNGYRVLNGRRLYFEGRRSEAEKEFQIAIDSAKGLVEIRDISMLGKLWYLERTAPEKATDFSKTLVVQLTLDQINLRDEAVQAYLTERDILIALITRHDEPDLGPNAPPFNWMVNGSFFLGISALVVLFIGTLRKKYDHAQVVLLATIAVVIVLLGIGVFMILNPGPEGKSPTVVKLLGQEISSGNVGLLLLFMAVAIIGTALKFNNDKNHPDKNDPDKNHPPARVKTKVKKNTGKSNHDVADKIKDMIDRYEHQLAVTNDILEQERIRLTLEDLQKKLEELK